MNFRELRKGEKIVIDRLYHNLLNEDKIDDIVAELNKTVVATATNYEAEF